MGPPYFPVSTNGPDAAPSKTYYEQQREILVNEIAQVSTITRFSMERIAGFRISSFRLGCVLTNSQSLEVVLQNINKLNRSLEEVTSVGNEFAPVESLWSHFENVMAKDPNEQHEGTQEGATELEGETEVPPERK
jgi:DASH complex subunit DAD1